jgi:hypothetical protein
MTQHPERLDDRTSRTAWGILDRNRSSSQEFTMTKGIVTPLTAAGSSRPFEVVVRNVRSQENSA